MCGCVCVWYGGERVWTCGGERVWSVEVNVCGGVCVYVWM